MEQLQTAANWKNWFPGMDTAKLYYENGQEAGVILNEKSNRVLVIQDIKEREVIAQYKGIRQKKVLTGWNLLSDDFNSMTVQWYMDFSLRWYPWEKFSSILFEKQYGPQMEQGLDRLKKLLENN